jgi:tetratricopeptide (TPR) repeat protein
MLSTSLRSLVIATVFVFVMPLHAQEPWKWPEKPKNLQVLKDFTGEKLRPVMTGFTRALGVRCTYCHVGEENKPLTTYDFASDKNPNKDRARDMLRMLGSINDQLKKMSLSSEPRVNVWCHTCHRGRPRPLSLGEELGTAFREGGIDAAAKRYAELRERYYGRAAYDFGESTLNNLGYELLEKGDHATAIALFRLNATQFPQSGNAWDSLAEAYMRAGKKMLAETYYRKSLEVDPRNDNAIAKLRELGVKVE